MFLLKLYRMHELKNEVPLHVKTVFVPPLPVPLMV